MCVGSVVVVVTFVTPWQTVTALGVLDRCQYIFHECREIVLIRLHCTDAGSVGFEEAH